jgi:glutathione synthase/RimK-type ligase-like ATP-grasp enzyme
MIYSGFKNSNRAMAGTWPALIAMLNTHKIMVLKPKEGSMGRSTYKVQNQLELEQAWMDLLSKRRDFCMSPYVEIENEYRCIFLDQEMHICFRKNIPQIVGDGSSTVAKLVSNYEKVVHKKITLSMVVQAQLDNVLMKGERLLLDWCHNLSRGSRADKVVPRDLRELLLQLGRRAMRGLGLRFASVDIVRLVEGSTSTAKEEYVIPEDRLMVLEVNGSVSVGGYVTQNPGDFEVGQAMFSKAVSLYFDDVRQRKERESSSALKQ